MTREKLFHGILVFLLGYAIGCVLTLITEAIVDRFCPKTDKEFQSRFVEEYNRTYTNPEDQIK